MPYHPAPLRPARAWRALWPLAFAALTTTCDAPTDPGRSGRLTVVPAFRGEHRLQFSGLTIDSVRIVVVRPQAETVATFASRFAPEADTLAAELTIPLRSTSENFQVTLELLAGGVLVFTGTSTVTVTAGTVPRAPAPIPMTYAGPGANLASLRITPRDSGVRFGETLPFAVSAADGQGNAVPQFYVSWSTGSVEHTIRSDGLFRAGTARGRVVVRARAPNGVADSTAVFITPAPSAVAVAGGDAQAAPAGTALPLPLVVRVTAADALPVVGVPVTFAAATGGGTVQPASVATDSLGLAGTIATLGATTGQQTFAATVQGLPVVTFTATAQPPAGVPVAIQKTAGDNQSVAAGLAVPVPPAVQVVDGLGNGVAGVQVAFVVTAGAGIVTGDTVLTDNAGAAAVGSWTLGVTPGPNALSVTLPGFPSVPAAVFNATGLTPDPPITLFVPGGLVPVGGQAPLTITLGQPAPAGGVTVTVTSDSTQYLTVEAPGTVTIAAGDSLGTIGLNGVAVGVATVSASAPGYTSGVVPVGVTPNFLAVNPASVGVGQTTAVTIQAFPMPPSDLVVTVTSTDTAIVRVLTPSVTIPGGASSATATVEGVAAGAAGVLADAPGYAQGGGLVTVTTGGVPDTLLIVAGDSQTAFVSDTLAVRPTVQVLDALGAPVSGVDVAFLVSSGGGTVAVPTAVTDSLGMATPGSAWQLGPTPGTNTLDALLPLFPAVAPVTFTATGVPLPPQIVLSVFGSSVVGQARTGQLDVRLLQPAPAGGLTVTLATTRAGLLRIGSYTSDSGTVAFAQGDTLQSVTVFGDSVATGVDTVIATAPGYTPDTLEVPISLNLISLPTTLNVPLSQTVSLPINLSVAAPSGGVTVTVTSSDTTVVRVLTPAVTVPQGSQLANATVEGVAIGTATLTATNPNYAPDATAASVTASLNITATTINLNASFGSPLTVRLESGGSPVAAPAGGVAVTLSADSPACAAVPATLTVPQGLTSVTDTVRYGGTATLPCSTLVRVAGPPGFLGDSATANVAVQPPISISASPLGSGLQRASGGSLGASNHGGTTVRVMSADPTRALIAPDDSTTGAAFLDIPVGVGVTSFSYYVQALDGFTNDSVNIEASAPGFVPDTVLQRIFEPVLDIIFLGGTGNTLSASDPFQVRIGSPSSETGTFVNIEDAVRAGRAGLTVSVVNDSVAVADLVTNAGAADSVTVLIAARQARSPSTVAAGGVEFDYVAAGTTTVRAMGPGFRPVGTALGQTVTVSAPSISIFSMSIGGGLQRAVSGNLSASAHGGVTVTVRSLQPGVLLLAPDNTTLGADSVQLFIPDGTASFSYRVVGADSVTNSAAQVVAEIPGFTPDTATVSVFQPVLDIIFLNSTGNTLSANDPFQVRIGTPSGATGTFVNSEDVLRFGRAPVTISVVNDSVAVADLVTSAGAADSVTVQIDALQSRSPSSVATGGVEFDYIAGGATTVRASAPGFRPVATALGQTVTISAPQISLSNTLIGARLQRAINGSLSASAHGGVTLTLRSLQPGVLLLAPNDTTLGADSVQLFIPDGSASFSYRVVGVDTVTSGTAQVVAEIPGFTPDTATVNVYQPVADVIFLSSTATSLAANDPFQIRIGTPSNPTGTFVNIEDVLRFGHPALSATITSSAATVAQLVTQSQTGSMVTVPIAALQSRSPLTVAAGGVELDYLTTGTTVIAASIPGFRAIPADTQVVTVTAPTIALGAVTVGSALQQATSLTLSNSNHGGITVVVKSSNPAVALVAPDRTTPGTDSIMIPLADNVGSLSYYVQGVEGLTGSALQVTITATAPGFSQGSATATVVQPGLDIIFLATTGSAASTPNDPFQVRVGIPNSPTNSFISAEQEVRAGGPTLTATVTSSNPAAGTLVTSAQPGGAASVTVQIGPIQARSPLTVAGGGVEFDFVAAGTTTVAATIANFIAVTAASVLVTVNP